MAIIVQKYGGSSVATPEQIISIAKKIHQLKSNGHQVLAVVSAMGNTTDQLSKLAYQVSKAPIRRELDMLLSTGERVACSLLSMALNDLGCVSISFTGSQAGILTDDTHSNAQILDIKPVRVEEELKKNKVVVIAGFQGVSPQSKEITTLGRGGTDLTAVAMAHYFKAERCEILKEVDGVFSGDPNIVADAKQIPELSYEALQEMTFWGAKMLHHRASELALLKSQTLKISLAHKDSRGTIVHSHIQNQVENPMFEEKKVLSVNSHKRVLKLQISSTQHSEGYKLLADFLKSHTLPWPQILDSTQTEKGCSMLVTAPLETLEAIAHLSQSSQSISALPHEYASVTATCAGSIGTDLICTLTKAMDTNKVNFHHILLSPLSISFIVDAKQRESATLTLHQYS